jgi:hypothetical protein
MAYNHEKRLTAMLQIALSENNGRLARMAMQQLAKQAAQGQPWAIKECFDRLDGKPMQQIQVDREDRIKLVAVVPQKANSTEEWLKLIQEQKVIEHVGPIEELAESPAHPSNPQSPDRGQAQSQATDQHHGDQGIESLTPSIRDTLDMKAARARTKRPSLKVKLNPING